MKDIYKNNTQILTFFSKAQVKMAELSALLASEYYEDSIKDLFLGLSNFLESLDSPYYNLSITDTIRYIHYWNRRAKLKSVPFIQITDYIVNINSGSNSPSLSNLESSIKDALTRFPHNSLAGLQGGKTAERNHLSNEELAWLRCQMQKTPCPDKIPSTVTLSLVTNGNMYPSGYYELGTKITMVTLNGHINYNTYKQATSFNYRRNGGILGIKNTAPKSLEQPNPYMDNIGISTNTNYVFEAEFTDGVKSADTNIIFKPPMYYGTIAKNKSTTITTLLSKTKDVRDRGEMILSFDLPIGNTLLQENSHLVPFLLIPAEWGRFTTAYVSIFDFANDWASTPISVPLADGTTMSALLLTYNTQIEGTTSFRFNW